MGLEFGVVRQCRHMIKMVESKMATIFKMATNSLKNNDILKINKTMISAVIDNHYSTVIHIRIYLINTFLIKIVQSKMAAILSIDWPGTAF